MAQYMKRNVYVDIYPDVYSFFERNGCIEGFELIYFCAGICRYYLQNFQIESEVRCYMSSQFKQPVLNLNIKEFMDEDTKKLTKNILEPLIYTDMADLGTKDDLDCVRRKGIKINVIFSFFDVIYR
jgi:hypothetical protein